MRWLEPVPVEQFVGALGILFSATDETPQRLGCGFHLSRIDRFARVALTRFERIAAIRVIIVRELYPAFRA